jgi:hypothetical protein
MFRSLLIAATAVLVPLGAVAVAAIGDTPAAPLSITVYKTAQCGCCRSWVDHLRAHGFEVTAHDVADMGAVKKKLGVPDALTSCHTGVIGSYVIEGHVPAGDIRKLMASKAKVAGLAVPGMPVGSPGMEMPDMPADKYDVIAYTKAGKRRVFASH